MEFSRPSFRFGIDGLLDSTGAFLDDEHRMIWDGVFNWSKERLLSRDHKHPETGEKISLARLVDETGQIPTELFDEMAEMGFLGVTIPEEHGGSGLDQLSLSLIIEGISYGCPSLGVTTSVQNSLCAAVLMKWCKHPDLNQWLKRLASGQAIGTYLLSEAGSGSDAANMACKATLDGDHYVLDGAKMWITSGRESVLGVGGDPSRRGLGIVFATTDPALRTTDPARKHKAVLALVVDFAETEGVSIGKVEHKLGLRGSSTALVNFDGARVPKENLLVGEGVGFKIAMDTLDGGRIGISSQALGLLLRGIDLGREHVRAREQFGQAIANFGQVERPFAEMGAGYYTARLGTHNAAKLRDAGLDTGLAAACAKFSAADHAMKGALESLLAHGGMGFTTDCDIEMVYRTVPILGIYEGTHNIQRLVIARRLLGGD